jgi:UDP-2-acetamido-2,6-beta-L-arabino-hexul-4-ose reductase
MKILVTGSRGFIGKNLCLTLKNKGYDVFEYDVGSTEDDLHRFVKECDFIVHLAGINRPLNPEEFQDGNVNFSRKLIDVVEEEKSEAPILFSSSTQAELDNPYGQSKAMAEALFNNFGFNGHAVYVYRLYNVFGKWCKPNYNSVIATWCYNISHNLPIQINKAPEIDFVYVDDVVNEFINVIEQRPKPNYRIHYVEPSYHVTLQEIADLLYSFKKSREDLMVPLQDELSKKLYATYISYLEPDDFAYKLNPHSDDRGSFVECFKTASYGQVSVNISKPGITKGNHYHMTKNEKYLVVSGTCSIKLRQLQSDKVIEYICDGKDLKVVDIPTGYTHNITNIGKEDSITIMWASELFDPDHPDTFPMPVEVGDKK